MLVKVSCPCGGRFAFDVEPVNGQMPVAVNCPTCGADGTALANAVIAQNLAAAIAPAPPSAPTAEAPTFGLRIRSQAPAAPAVPAATAVPAPPEPPQASGGLKIRSRAAEPPAAAMPAPADAGPETAPAAPAKPSRPAHAPGGYIPKDPPKPRFLMGVVGSFAGATLGGAIWYAVYYFGGIDFGWCALIPAVAAGFSTRVLARHDNTNLGIIAAFCTLLAIFGTRYLIVVHNIGKDTHKFVPQTYDEHLAEAQKAVKVKTDKEIIDFIQTQHRAEFDRTAEEGDKFDPISVPRDRIQAFRDYDIKTYQSFIDGTPSREAYDQQNADAQSAMETGTRFLAVAQAVISTGIFGIFTTIFALGVAYRTGSG